MCFLVDGNTTLTCDILIVISQHNVTYCQVALNRPVTCLQGWQPGPKITHFIMKLARGMGLVKVVSVVVQFFIA